MTRESKSAVVCKEVTSTPPSVPLSFLSPPLLSFSPSPLYLWLVFSKDNWRQNLICSMSWTGMRFHRRLLPPWKRRRWAAADAATSAHPRLPRPNAQEAAAARTVWTPPHRAVSTPGRPATSWWTRRRTEKRSPSFSIHGCAEPGGAAAAEVEEEEAAAVSGWRTLRQEGEPRPRVPGETPTRSPTTRTQRTLPPLHGPLLPPEPPRPRHPVRAMLPSAARPAEYLGRRRRNQRSRSRF